MAVLRKYNTVTGQWEILQGGVQGLQGPPVALSKGTVTTTAAGTNADFSITGTPPAQVLHLTLPRGEAGGWVAAAILADGTDLNTLFTQGTYRTADSSGTTATGFPVNGFFGYVEIIGNTGVVFQRATHQSFSSNPSMWVRTYSGSTWSSWRRIPTVGQIDLDIVGAGRPDVAGTMTTEVAALVAAATSGAKFRSTDGPQGAWEWQKRGATWVPTEVELHTLNIAPLLDPLFAASNLRLSRFGRTVSLNAIIYVPVGSPLIGASRATMRTLFVCPNGFQWSINYLPVSPATLGGTVGHAYLNDGNRLQAGGGLGVWAANDVMAFNATWVTGASAPTITTF